MFRLGVRKNDAAYVKKFGNTAHHIKALIFLHSFRRLANKKTQIHIFHIVFRYYKEVKSIEHQNL